MIALTVTARLQHGAALDARFGIGLDGLLTSLVRDRAKAAHAVTSGSSLDGGTHTPTPTLVDLPLARCPSDPWHWMATTAYPLGWDRQPIPVSPDVHHIRYSHQREVAEQVGLNLPKNTPISQGRFRSRRLPVITFPAAYLQFRAVGDPDVITDLLQDCHSMGGHRHSGEGAVLGWNVTEAETLDVDRWGHTHCDGTLGRPVPTECATRLGLDGPTGTVGVRPPVWHQATQHLLVLPTYPKERHASRQD